MKPSDINLGSFPPLTNTFGKTEAELAAALMVHTLHIAGDAFRPLSWSEVVDTITAEVAANRGPWAKLMANPMFRPSLPELMKPHDNPDGSSYRFVEQIADGRYQFTDHGIAALLKRTCKQCEHFDGGGLGPTNQPRNYAGDCHNPKSGRFTVYASDTCAGFCKADR